MSQIGLAELDDLSLGAVFLATGGGGDPYAPMLVTREALKQYGPVSLIAPNDLADDALIAAIGSVGAPTVSLELLPSVDEAALALDAFEAHIGRKVDALVSFEIGGGNSLIPLAAAAQRGLPVVDGDGMGRALPEAQMMTFAIAGVHPTPAICLDYEGGITTFDTSSTDVYERQIRGIALCMGGMVTTVEHMMTGAQLKSAIIPHTVSFARRIGAVLREHRGHADHLLTPLRSAFDGSVYGEVRKLFAGKVVDKATKIIGGFDIGTASIAAFGDPEDRLEITIKNEYLLAERGGQRLASVPDLITIVDQETSEPINAERLRFGQRVAVFAIGCPEFFHTPSALAKTGPRAFGFDFDYVPLKPSHG